MAIARVAGAHQLNTDGSAIAVSTSRGRRKPAKPILAIGAELPSSGELPK
jgi:hypothetical protein